mmetsp:Transcript_40025/g.89787  ORF Transcript_40025/g.89787 Transcript_40025/m.89787 type:complete len:690 (-) Transcript_40025:91-2160(-)
MSSFVVDFEVLPPDDPGDRPADEVIRDLGRQMQSRSGPLYRGDMARYFERATLADDEFDARSEVHRRPSHTAAGDFGQPDTRHERDFHRTSSSHSRTEVHRQLAHTAAGDFGQLDTRHERDFHTAGTSRTEVLERELRDAQESQRADHARAQRAEQMLKDREQLLVHAKEMWMKESARASKLADALTLAQDRMTDQEKRLQELSDRYNDASQEVRQLRHLLDSPDGGGYGVGYAPSSMQPGMQQLGMPGGKAMLGMAGVVPPHSDKGVPSQEFGAPAPMPAGSMNYQGGSFHDQQEAHMHDPYAGAPGSAAFSTASAGMHTQGIQHGGAAYPHNGMPQLASHNGMQQLTYQNGVPQQPSLAGMQQQPPMRTASSIVIPPPLEADTNTERFRHLCIANDAVLAEDEMLQIGVKAEFQGLEGQMAVYYGNKANAALQAFSVQFYVREDHAVKLSVSSIAHQLEPMQQAVQRVSIHMLAPFAEPPVLRVQYLLPDASPRKITMRFPLVLTKFMRGRELSQQEFFRLWRDQHFVLNEVTSVCNLAPRLRSALVYIARSIVAGGALRLHSGFDTNPDNFVLVGQLAGRLPHGGPGMTDPNHSYGEGHATSAYGTNHSDGMYGSVGPGAGGDTDKDLGLSLVRVEVGSGRFAGKARVVVRSSHPHVARGLCECLLLQLTEPHSSGVDTQTHVMVR